MISREYKRVILGCLFLFAFISCISFVFSADVGYIVENKYYINKDFIGVMNEFNLSYEIIYSSNLSTANFSKYKMIIFNDEDFQNPGLIPVNNVPAVILNGHHMVYWGWTKYISKTSQSDIFHIDLIDFNTTITQGFNKTDVQIYTSKDPDIYSLDWENIYSGINIVASKKNLPGDAVIATADAGSILTYPGRPDTHVNAKTCFFGIYQTEYWTNDTKQLFRGCMGFVAITCSNDNDCNDNNLYTQDTCINPGTVNSYCKHEQIRCFSNSDCGTNSYSNNYCFSGDVYKNLTSFSCLNSGTTGSFCTNTTQKNLFDDCVRECLNGECILAHDLSFQENYDGFGNRIRLRDPNNTNINNPAIITQKGGYDIQFQIINNGDFNESASVSCRIQNSSGWDIYLWSSSINLAPGSTTASGNKDNYNLSGYKNGDYTLKCNITNPGDDSPSNNYAERTFTINYPSINCTLDSDCGTDGFFGNNFCTGKNITRNYKDYTCNNPGTSGSYCSNSQIPKLIEECSDYCSNGICKDFICERNEDCNDENPLTYDECINPSTPISECRNTQINCNSDNDCGYTGSLGEQYCNRNKVYKNYQESFCNNAGTLESYCTLRVTASLKYQCDFACTGNGTCINCDQNSDCNDNNSSTNDICINPGTVESYCRNNLTIINCDSNSQCGAQTSTLSCSGNNLVNTTITPTCNYAGTTSSYCNNASSSSSILCAYGCNSTAIPPRCNNITIPPNITCFNNSDCNDNNIYTKDICINPGTISSFCSYQNITCWTNFDCNDGNPLTNDICHLAGTVESYCTHININIPCYTNSDCGTDGFTGNLFCSGKNVTGNFITFICHSPGTTSSYCSNSITTKLNKTCSDYCLDGECKNFICETDSDCDDNNSTTIDACINASTPQSYCIHEEQCIFDSGWKNLNTQNGACIEDNGDCHDTACQIEGGYCGCDASGFGLDWIQLYPEDGCVNNNGYRFLCQGTNSDTWNCNIVAGTGAGKLANIPYIGYYYLSIDAEWDSEYEKLFVGANEWGNNNNRREAFDFSSRVKCVYKEPFYLNSVPAKLWVEASSLSGSVHVYNGRYSTCIPADVQYYCDDRSPVI